MVYYLANWIPCLIEHLTEDFNAIYGELKDAVNDYYANHEVTLNIEDLPNVDNKMTL